MKFDLLSFGWGILAFAVAALVLILGFGMGRESIAKDCKRLGAFHEEKITYKCEAPK